MGYRDYAKDYEIEYLERPGKRRPKVRKIYVGPYFRFTNTPEHIRCLRRQYLLLLILTSVSLLIPMCIDCVFSRTWYIEVPAVSAWIPWLLSAGAVWRLWTAKKLVNREHYELMHDRMSGASLFLTGFCSISAIGCIYKGMHQSVSAKDWVVCICCLLSVFFSCAMFAKRKELEMVRVENSEKPQKKEQ